MSLMGRGAKNYFSFSFPSYQRKSRKSRKTIIRYHVPNWVGAFQNHVRHCPLLAPDFPLALALRGADAMWTILFTLTFMIAISLNLFALSQTD